MNTIDAGFVVPIPQFVSSLRPQMLSQGAEALTLLVDNPIDSSADKCVVKYRPPKSYRILELDKSLRKKRTTAEIKVLEKLAGAGVACPALVKQDVRNGLIYMEFIAGSTLKEFVWQQEGLKNAGNPPLLNLFSQFGRLVSQMHQANVTHGDLTTSNVLVKSDDTLCVIDFGLSNMSANIEDKAVDLYVLERAIESTHAQVSAMLVERVLDGYNDAYKDKEQHRQIMSRLDTVRQRGRKRSMLG